VVGRLFPVITIGLFMLGFALIAEAIRVLVNPVREVQRKCCACAISRMSSRVEPNSASAQVCINNRT
jgi:hypothetical protein